MAIPQFVNVSGKNLLPVGEHRTTLKEIEAHFASNPHRAALWAKAQPAIEQYIAAGGRRIYFDGSFTSDKEFPNDIDGCWTLEGVDLAKLDPVLLSYYPLGTELMKMKYGLDFYPAELPEGKSKKLFPDFFQVDRDGDQKGILVVDF